MCARCRLGNMGQTHSLLGGYGTIERRREVSRCSRQGATPRSVRRAATARRMCVTPEIDCALPASPDCGLLEVIARSRGRQEAAAVGGSFSQPGRNTSILRTEQGVRLAPIYDLVPQHRAIAPDSELKAVAIAEDVILVFCLDCLELAVR